MQHNNLKETVSSFFCKGQTLEQTVDCSINNSVMDHDTSLIHSNRNESSQRNIQNIQIKTILMKHNQDDNTSSQKQNIQKNTDIEISFGNRLQNLLDRVEKLKIPSQKISLSKIEDLKRKAQSIYQKKVRQQQLLKKIIEKKQKTLAQRQKWTKERIHMLPRLHNICYVSQKEGGNVQKLQKDFLAHQVTDSQVSSNSVYKNQEIPVLKTQLQRNQEDKRAFTLEVASQNFNTVRKEQNGINIISKTNEKKQAENDPQIQKVQKKPITLQVSVQKKEEKKSVSSPRGAQTEKISTEVKEVKQKQEIKKNKKPKGNQKRR